MTADASRGPLLALLHRAESVEAYPSEPSDEDLAQAIGLPVTAILRFDMNTLGGGPLLGVWRLTAASLRSKHSSTVTWPIGVSGRRLVRTWAFRRGASSSVPARTS
jgi:hypothetical protein